MPAQTETTTSPMEIVDQSQGKMRQVVKGIDIESKADGTPTIIEGYIATKGVDRKKDMFSEQALKQMARQINEEVESGDADIKIMFPDFEEQDLEDIKKQNFTANGNIHHNNNPAFPLSDPRIVSAYKIIEAEYDGFGVKVRAELNEDLPFGVPEAIKGALREGYLDGFSVEWITRKARTVEKDGMTVRKILEVLFTGAALTGRPVNSAAKVTDTEFKAMLMGNDEIEFKAEYMFETGQMVEWSSSGGMTRGEIVDRTKNSCFNERIDGDVEVCGTEDDPAYLIEVDNEEETMVAHLQGTLNAAQEGRAQIPEALQEELGEDRFIPPEKAADNARKALRWKEEKDAPGGEQQGTDTAEKIIDAVEENEPLSPSFISEIASFDRHREQGNHEIDEEYEGSPWKDAGYVAWLLWGGDAGVDWAQKLNNRMQDIESKAQHMEEKTQHYKAQAGSVTFRGLKDGELDESEIPNDDYQSHYLNVADTKTDSSYPVVDGDGFLRYDNVQSAWNLRGQAEGISKAELENKLEELNQEFMDSDKFDEPPIDPELIQENKSFINGLAEMEDEEIEQEVKSLRELRQEFKNNITGDTMPEENNDEPDNDPSDEDNQDNVEDQESKAEELRNELSELKQEVKALQEQNEELKEEKQEYKSKIEDLDELQEFKSDLEGLKQEIKSMTPEDKPQQDQDQTRDETVSDQESKSALENQLSQYDNPEAMVDDQNFKSVLADKHNTSESKVEEVAEQVAE